MGILIPEGFPFQTLNVAAMGGPADEAIANGTVEFLEPLGTASKDVFSDESLATSITTPITLDVNGEYSGGPIYGSGTYKVVAKDSNGHEVWTRNNVEADGLGIDRIVRQFGTDAETNSHQGIRAGSIIETRYHDDARVARSNGSFRFTGTINAAKSGWPNADGRFYDTDGRQFEILPPLNPLQFGARGDDMHDDAFAINTALFASFGTEVVFPRPKEAYRIESPIETQWVANSLRGEHENGCKIKAYHTSGPAILINEDKCSVSQLTILADDTRTSQAVIEDKAGIVVEPQGSDVLINTTINNVSVRDQPGHAIHFSGTVLVAELHVFSIQRCKGHGVYVDDGTERSATQGRPGGIHISEGVIAECSGHSLRIGGGTTTPYRVRLYNIDTRENANLFTQQGGETYEPSSVTASDHNCWFRAESSEISLCGFDGGTQIGGLYVAGRSVHVRNCRYNNIATEAVRVEDSATDGIFVDELLVSAPTASLDPAVVIAPSQARNVAVRTRCSNDAPSGPNLVTKLVSDDLAVQQTNGGFNEILSESNALQFKTGRVITLATNQAASLDFSGDARGILAISGSLDERGAALVHFRVGNNLHADVMSSSGSPTVVGTTGILDGDTGAAGDLTISAADNNRLYIENRTGGTAVYAVTLLSVSSGFLEDVTTYLPAAMGGT